MSLPLPSITAASPQRRQRSRNQLFYPIMMVVDTAREESERMSAADLSAARSLARELNIQWRYVSPGDCHIDF